MNRRKFWKKGSLARGILVAVLTTVAVLLIGFAIKYFQGEL